MPRAGLVQAAGYRRRADAKMADATTVSFTDSQASPLGSTYHIYGAGLSGIGAGLVLHFDGDGVYGTLTPTDTYALAGNRGLIAVARAKGYALVSVKPPDTTGTVTWWEAGGRNADYVADLLVYLRATYGFSPARTWLLGFSGGAQFISQNFVPEYGTSLLAGGGGAVIMGGGGTYTGTPTFSAALKSNFAMHWRTGLLDDGTFVSDSYDALTDAQAGRTQYNGQGFATTTISTPSGLGHELDASFGPVLDDVLPALPGYALPYTTPTTPGATRPALVNSYLATATGTSTTTSSSFTPSAGEVIVVKTWSQTLNTPNFATCVGTSGGAALSFAVAQHLQASAKSEVMIFVAKVGATSPGAMTVQVFWTGTSGEHGMVVERWSSAQVTGTPAAATPITGSGAPSATVTTTTDHSVISWLCADRGVVAGSATYRNSATQTQTNTATNIRMYAAYNSPSSVGSQTIGLSAPAGQNWTLAGIEILPGP